MKNFFSTVFFLCIFFTGSAQPAWDGLQWDKWNVPNVPSKGIRTLIPNKEILFSINAAHLKNQLFSLPENSEDGKTMELPLPDGSMLLFKLWRYNIMEEALANKYPQIRSFSGYAVENKAITVKLDYTEFGFHAIVFHPSGTYFIDPYSNVDDGFYSCYYERDYTKHAGQIMQCIGRNELAYAPEHTFSTPAKLRMNGSSKRIFRLALACTGEYAIAVAGANQTKSAVLSKMLTTINRVNGVYERELAVHMTLVGNNDTLIFLDPATDPYSNNSSASTMLSENPGVINSRIGLANYDIGHVFTTGGGGQATIGGLCINNSKAQGVTGLTNPQGDAFDIDFVAHEMGHQFGAEHTFNASTGSCGGNGEWMSAFEPGSGSTIMAYAGYCGGANNLQSNSDDYFHAISLIQITDTLSSGIRATCGITSPVTNNPPAVAPFSQSYYIPKLTPFELTAPTVTDTDHDTLTYCWEQWNLGNFGTSWNATSTHGPIFRSFRPGSNATRVFPKIDTLVDGVTSYLGERLPDVNRFLTFKLTVRDIYNGIGAFSLPDDTIHLDVVTSAGPFNVTTPSSSVNWLGSTNELITWNVANTNNAPVNCTNVSILLSVDGGLTYPHVLAANTPNDGSEIITVPNITSTTTARIKVKAVNNVFFNINPVNFILTHNTGIKNISWQNGLTIFPVPANDMLHLMSSTNTQLNVHIINAVGQTIFEGTLNQKLDILVNFWAKGVYYIQLINNDTGEKLIRPIVIN